MSTGITPRPERFSLEEDQPEPEPREGAELLRAAEKGDKARLTQQESGDALEWFLSDEQQDLSSVIQINVGSRDEPKWIDWTVKPVDMDKLRRIRKAAASKNNGRQRGGGGDQFDETGANLQIVVEGTVSPDLRAAAKAMGVIDPTDALRRRFKHKPGLVTQISSEIMSVSGYDDEDVREVDAAQG